MTYTIYCPPHISKSLLMQPEIAEAVSALRKERKRLDAYFKEEHRKAFITMLNNIADTRSYVQKKSRKRKCLHRLQVVMKCRFRGGYGR